MASAFDRLVRECGPEGDPHQAVNAGRDLEAAGDFRAAATAYDRAFGLAPSDLEIARARQDLLDRLALEELGLRFRYVPAGTFLMGSEAGDPDERPVHPVRLGGYWMAETPVSWADYCRLLGWLPPPEGQPQPLPAAGEKWSDADFALFILNKIRLQYCENETVTALDWHRHRPEMKWDAGGEEKTSRELFGEPPRADPEAPWGYDRKPMVAVRWHDAAGFCAVVSGGPVRYRLPTEAEWEKAARGGLIERRYPWGDEPPSAERCDFDRFQQFSVLPTRRLPPNGYGLYAMSGGVWEWTSDWYDGSYYGSSPLESPTGPAQGSERVLRGGSWADCAEAVTVSFRMSVKTYEPGERGWGREISPNIGFRLVREELT
jgi:formylglycine-generating enzyme required for sulfatase activity